MFCVEMDWTAREKASVQFGDNMVYSLSTVPTVLSDKSNRPVQPWF